MSVMLTSFDIMLLMLAYRRSGLTLFCSHLYLCLVMNTADSTCRKWYINFIACWYELVLTCMTQVLLQWPVSNSSSTHSFHFSIMQMVIQD